MENKLKRKLKLSCLSLLAILISMTNIKCKTEKKDEFIPIVVYKSSSLLITQITKHSFIHTSYKQTDDFGNVPCNGSIIITNNESVIFDTPTSNSTSQELINWIKETRQCKIIAIIPTHFHDDCLGGLKAFHENNIPSYSFFKTIQLAKENNFEVPKNSFNDSLVLNVGNEIVIAKFFGQGHTKDNIIGYFPCEDVMFGGCLIKELNAHKGYLGDANVKDWSKTVEKIKNDYPNVKKVIPGHGTYGNQQLLDYTINLFKQ